MRRGWMWGLRAAVVGSSVLLGCATPVRIVQRQRMADAPVPGAAGERTVDFAPLFQSLSTSYSAYAGRDPGMMQRVLLSPNLVFESSRSSVDEPKTSGPDKPPSTTPYLENGLGLPVDIELSSLLIRYLTAPPRSSNVLAPALTKRWDPDIWCWGAKDCFEATWVERLLLMHTRLPERDGKGNFAPGSSPEELPTSALAVRKLGAYVRKVSVVAEERGDVLVFRPRRNPSEQSVCKIPDIDVPVVAFQAELVSLRDGRILARIDETRNVSSTEVPRPRVRAFRWVPQRSSDYSQQYMPTRHMVEHSRYEYVSGWTKEGVACAGALEAYQAWLSGFWERLDSLRVAALTEMFDCSLKTLYGPASTCADALASARSTSAGSGGTGAGTSESDFLPMPAPNPDRGPKRAPLVPSDDGK